MNMEVAKQFIEIAERVAEKKAKESATSKWAVLVGMLEAAIDTLPENSQNQQHLKNFISIWEKQDKEFSEKN